MSATPIADAIRAIEDRIGDERYWTKHSRAYRRDDGTFIHCLLGAAGRATGAIPGGAANEWVRYATTRAFLESVVCEFTADPDGFGLPVISFNDEDATTHADVMLFLATALDVAEAEGL